MNQITIKTSVIKGITNCLANKKSLKEALKNIYFNKGYVYATNSQIAIKTALEGVTESLENSTVYKIIEINKKDRDFSNVIIEKTDFDYPPIEKLFDDIKAISREKIELNLENDIQISKSMFILYNETKNMYQYKLLEKLVTIGGYWDAYDQGIDKAIYLTNKYYEDYNRRSDVIILPFKIKKGSVK